MSDTMVRRVRFIEHVCGLLIDEHLKPVVLALFMAVPAAFWSAPASSSGAHHPAYALGDGGLLRHTLVVMHLSLDLANTYGYTQADWEADAIILAAAFHDTYKGGDTGIEPWTETVKEHPVIAGERLSAAAQKLVEPRAVTVRLAAMIVNAHMSMWGPDPTAIDMLHPLSEIVATADYIASRKYLEPSAELAELLELFR